jgi:hypothetical protein
LCNKLQHFVQYNGLIEVFKINFNKSAGADFYWMKRLGMFAIWDFLTDIESMSEFGAWLP